MDENLELLQYIYKNAEMGTYSTEKLINNINGKENKIKKCIEGILKGYENFKKDSEKLIKENNYETKDNTTMSKIGTSMGIKMEVLKDNSDAAIAHLLTEGLTMGVVDITSKIDRYEDDANKDILKLAKKYLKFQNEAINFLKEYL